ncbi:MAG: hypothetical protein NT076_02225 [Candidatus Pacearchaeota archaeon]|nr:hypothetical protein [Candidatus Pacearchaeota archaeon]
MPIYSAIDNFIRIFDRKAPLYLAVAVLGLAGLTYGVVSIARSLPDPAPLIDKFREIKTLETKNMEDKATKEFDRLAEKAIRNSQAR